MINLKERREDSMKQIYRSQAILKSIGILHPSLLAVTATILLATPAAFAATEFQGSLNSVSITDASETNAPPTATFTYTQDGDTFTFDANASTDSDGTIIGYKWDFGDGNSATNVSVTHTYDSAQTYPVTLQTLDNDNGVSIAQIIVSNNLPIIIVEQLVSDSDTGNISVAKSYGQGIYFTEPTTIQSITIKTGPNLYGTPPTKLRIGTSKELSTSFLAESNEILLTAKNTEYEFTLTEPVQLKTKNQYYFAVSVTNDSTANFVDLSASATDSYSPGQCPDCHLFYKNTAKWNINGLKYSKDLFFRIK